jgi:hypothetical protein
MRISKVNITNFVNYEWEECFCSGEFSFVYTFKISVDGKDFISLGGSTVCFQISRTPPPTPHRPPARHLKLLVASFEVHLSLSLSFNEVCNQRFPNFSKVCP